MDILAGLGQGFAVALQPINLLYCFIGVFIGTLVGVLPGIGPVSAMSLLLPVTLSGTPESGIIMMAGIYYGSMYGGSTTSILVNIPGEAASVVTCLDGHEMAKQGRAGPALGMAALGIFRRRHLRHHRADAGGAFACPRRRRLRPARVLLADGAGPHHPELPEPGVDGQVAADGRVRHRAGSHRHGPDHGSGAAHLRPARAARRHRPRAGGHGPVRRGRDPVQPRAGAQARGDQGAHRRAVALARRLDSSRGGRSCAARCLASSSASCREAGR